MRAIIGAVDGTHVEIVQPPATNLFMPPRIFINRKGKISINVMLVSKHFIDFYIKYKHYKLQISDSDCRILAANARFPGSNHDAAVWQASSVRALLHEEFMRGERMSFLIGKLCKAYEFVNEIF